MAGAAFSSLSAKTKLLGVSKLCNYRQIRVWEARKHCACAQIRLNRLLQIRWALKSACLEPLGAQIGRSRATGCSNRLLQSH